MKFTKRKIKKERSEEALLATPQIQETEIIPLSESITLSAADTSIEFSTPMVDAIIYATARAKNVAVVTSDPHFKKLDNIIFIEKS